MTRQDFDDLVRRIEARYDGRPAALRRSTARWVALGLAGAVGWLLLLFLSGAALFAAGTVLAEPAGSIAALVVGSLLIVYGVAQAGLFLLTDLEPPEGHVVRPGEAPALLERLDALRRELDCRPFDEVRISTDFNAAVHELPRLGMFGLPRTVLEIGLPLASVLAPDELCAVLAHEFSHLSARHGRSGGRIYRVHKTWGHIFERMRHPASGQLGQSARWAVMRFVGWYWPRLHARALVLSRLHEFHADRVAADIAGAPAVTSALWRMECLHPWLAERFWPDIHQEADRSPEPPADVYRRMRLALEAPPAPDDAARWTERGLSRATTRGETHPAFVDRARALGVPPDEARLGGFPAPVRPTAAEVLLGPALGPIEDELAALWRKETAGGWRERHRRAAAEARRREAAARAAEAGDAAALWEAARAEAELRGLAPAEPLLRAVLDRDPDHPGAGVLLGQHRLGLGDPEGERLLLQVVDRADESWMARACDALQEHYRATGQLDRLREIRGRLDRHEVDLADARRERSTIRPGDPLAPHGLTDEALAPLRALLAAQPACTAAWLARKELRHFAHRPLFLLAVRGEPGRWGFGDPERDAALVKRLIPLVELPGQVLVLSRLGGFRKLAARVMALPGAEVFRRDGASGRADDRWPIPIGDG